MVISVWTSLYIVIPIYQLLSHHHCVNGVDVIIIIIALSHCSALFHGFLCILINVTPVGRKLPHVTCGQPGVFQCRSHISNMFGTCWAVCSLLYGVQKDLHIPDAILITLSGTWVPGCAVKFSSLFLQFKPKHKQMSVSLFYFLPPSVVAHISHFLIMELPKVSFLNLYYDEMN